MGIQGLWTFLKTKHLELFKDITELTNFAGQRWGIDTSLYMHRLGCDVTQSPIPLFLEQARLLREAGIIPVYLFDGKRHPVKVHEHERRADQAHKTAENTALRANVLDQLPTFTSDDEMRAFIVAHGPREAKRALVETKMMDITGCGTIEIERPLAQVVQAMQSRHAHAETSVAVFSDAVYHELMAALDEEHIGFYIALGDAEKLGAYLCKTGQLEALVTDDGDALAFGAPCIIRNLFRSGASGMQYITLATVVACLNLTQEQFVDMCILCGCDYTKSRGLPTVGPAKALTLIQKHQSIAQYLLSPEWTTLALRLAQNPKYNTFQLDDFQHAAAREMFLDTSNQIGYTSTVLAPGTARAPQSIRGINPVVMASKAINTTSFF